MHTPVCPTKVRHISVNKDSIKLKNICLQWLINTQEPKKHNYIFFRKCPIQFQFRSCFILINFTSNGLHCWWIQLMQHLDSFIILESTGLTLTLQLYKKNEIRFQRKCRDYTTMVTGWKGQEMVTTYNRQEIKKVWETHSNPIHSSNLLLPDKLGLDCCVFIILISGMHVIAGPC